MRLRDRAVLLIKLVVFFAISHLLFISVSEKQAELCSVNGFSEGISIAYIPINIKHKFSGENIWNGLYEQLGSVFAGIVTFLKVRFPKTVS